MIAPRRSTLFCDVESLTAPDLGSVGALARLQLEARRVGLELRLRGVSPELRELIAFVGLDDVLSVETRREPEEREERLGVEEESQLRDPAA
jgi:anti-anti-sigma regulatory factor